MRITTTYRKVGAFYIACFIDAFDARLPHWLKIQDLLQLLRIELDGLGLVRMAGRNEIGELLGEDLEGRGSLLLFDAHLSLEQRSGLHSTKDFVLRV